MWIYTLEARILHFTLGIINALQVWEICTKYVKYTCGKGKKSTCFKKILLFFKIGIITNIHRTIHVYPFCLCLKTSPIPHSTFPFRLTSPYHCDNHPLSPIFNRVSSGSRLFFPFGFQCLAFIKYLLKTSNYLFLADRFGSSISFKPLWQQSLGTSRTGKTLKTKR